MKISFYDIICIAPINKLRTNLHRKLIMLIIKNENELRIFGCSNGFLSLIKESLPDINKEDLYEDYCYMSSLLRSIKYNFLKYDQYLKTKHLYPLLELPYTEIDIDYITLYERHKNILKPDDPNLLKNQSNLSINLNFDNLIDEAMISICKKDMPNLSDKEIKEFIENTKNKLKSP